MSQSSSAQASTRARLHLAPNIRSNNWTEDNSSDDVQQELKADKSGALYVPVPPTLSLKVGAALTHMLGFLVFCLMWYTLKKFLSPSAPIAWRSFALHPLLMSLAFGVLGPIGAVSWRTYEHVLGMSHATVKMVHLVLMLAAAGVGALGVIDMWLVHADGAAAQVQNGWDVHFQSVHSWLGIAALVTWVAQAAAGLITFANPACSRFDRKAFMPIHIFVGSFALFGTLLSIITGILSLGYRGDNAAPKDVLFKVTASCTFLLCGAVALVFAAPKPQ